MEIIDVAFQKYHYKSVDMQQHYILTDDLEISVSDVIICTRSLEHKNQGFVGFKSGVCKYMYHLNLGVLCLRSEMLLLTHYFLVLFTRFHGKSSLEDQKKRLNQKLMKHI